MPNYTDDRRWEVERIDSTGVKTRLLAGKSLISGLGEVLVDVDFPIIFAEEPSCSFGSVMDGGFPVNPGKFPTVSATVSAWQTIPKQGSGTGFFYTGATMAIVITGDSTLSEQQLWVNWNFIGAAFQNPVDIEESGAV